MKKKVIRKPVIIQVQIKHERETEVTLTNDRVIIMNKITYTTAFLLCNT